MRPDQCRSVQVVGCNSGGEPQPEGPPNRIRVVQLKRRGNAPLGFSIRGGREHGTGVFVSHVAPNSEAHHRGLKVGDQIVRINGYPVDYFVHEEVLALLKARSSIVLKVKSVGMIPIKDNKRDPITWQFVEAEQCSSGSDGTAHSVSSASSLDEPVETKVFISGVGSSSLGCSVVKGPPELPGIFVQTVKPHGLAEMAGLEIADQVTEVNGRTLDNLEFAEAIAMLKSFKEMALTVKKGAGMELFPEEQRRRRLSRGFGECRLHPQPNGNDRGRLQDELITSGGGSAGSWSHGTITNGSSGTHSMEGSLSSSQSTSPVANGRASHCLELSNKYRVTENGASHHHRGGGHSNSETEERQRLEEEKRRLQEKEEQLRLEAEKLAAERRRLQLEASVVQPILQPVPPPPPCNVFAELHSVAEKKRISRENSAQQNGDRNSSRHGPKEDSASSRDVLIKQKQHEQLMVEFREVHQKMFGGNGTTNSEPVSRTVSGQSHPAAKSAAASLGAPEGRRPQRQGYSADQLPSPPSSAQFQQMAAKESMATMLEQETAKLAEAASRTDSVMEPGTPKKQWPVYVPPARPNPHMFIQPTNSQNSPKVAPQPPTTQEKTAKVGKPCKGPAPPPPVGPKDVSPITDSRGPELKPPHTFFSEKPLVTIGTYPDPSNPRPNRFVPRPPKVEIVESDSKCSTLEKSTTSLKLASEKPSLTAGPKMTVSINTKPPNHPSLSTRFNTTPGANQVPVNSINNINNNNNNDTDTGAVVKTFTFKKDGILNLNIEGGLNSSHEGRIVVSEIREGGLVPVDGEIQKGDQLLMVNNMRLVNVSLTAARVALQNAMGNDGKELRLTIAKLPR
ncbi:whirlin-like isoform X1 [Ornithodoros turicata]|uniref:whirlin-like isoform X1 n=1 Tax=Ornithodoros turicata TaxID=34597 RepID=UPI00313A3B87